jgi:uncharacterized protein DUF6540
MSSAPPPPPHLPPVIKKAPTPPAPKPPAVALAGPAGAFLVELLIYNGQPFEDHWAYFVRSHANPDIGVLINATGDMKNGFQFEVKRSHDFNATSSFPQRIPLQWVDAKYFNEKAMLNDGKREVDHKPVCGFETSAHKVEAPKKSLNTVEDVVSFQHDFLHNPCPRDTCLPVPALGYTVYFRDPILHTFYLWYTAAGICQLNRIFLGHTRPQDVAKELPDMDC